MPQLTETILFGLALLIGVTAFIAWPFMSRPARRARRARRAAGESTALAARQAHIVAEIRDLDFDHSLGKLAEEDYQALRAELVSEGAELLRHMDLARGVKPAAAAPRAAAPADTLESEIAARRKAKAQAAAPAAAGKCPQCERSVHPDDVFCPRCGARLSANSTKKVAA